MGRGACGRCTDLFSSGQSTDWPNVARRSFRSHPCISHSLCLCAAKSARSQKTVPCKPTRSRAILAVIPSKYLTKPAKVAVVGILPTLAPVGPGRWVVASYHPIRRSPHVPTWAIRCRRRRRHHSPQIRHTTSGVPPAGSRPHRDLAIREVCGGSHHRLRRCRRRSRSPPVYEPLGWDERTGNGHNVLAWLHPFSESVTRIRHTPLAHTHTGTYTVREGVRDGFIYRGRESVFILIFQPFCCFRIRHKRP